MQGWIKIHRKIADNQIFKDPYSLKLWMLCLLKAAHKPYRQLVGRQAVQVGFGQFITGVNSISDEFNNGIEKKHQKSRATVWRILQNLEQEQMVKIESYTRYSIITVVNWSQYQTDDETVNPPVPQPLKPESKSKSEKKKKEFEEDDTYYKMAIYYREKVDAMAEENGLKNLTKRANMQSWAREFKLLVERDGQTDKRLIQAVMDWVVIDDFWKRNVLSAKKFREQFPKLVLKMQAEKKIQLPNTVERQRQQQYEDQLREWIMQGGTPDDFRYDDSS